MAEPEASFEAKTEIDGKTSKATVEVFDDRLEITSQGKRVSAGKLVAGTLTAGMSLAATGVRKGAREGAGMVVPASHVAAVANEGKKRIRLRLTSDEAIDFKVDKDDLADAVAALKALVLADTGASPEPTPAADNANERLRKLEELRDQGLISDEEHAAKRAEILDQL